MGWTFTPGKRAGNWPCVLMPSRHENSPADFQCDHNHEENNDRPDHFERTAPWAAPCHFDTIPDVHRLFVVICHPNILWQAPWHSNGNRDSPSDPSPGKSPVKSK